MIQVVEGFANISKNSLNVGAIQIKMFENSVKYINSAIHGAMIRPKSKLISVDFIMNIVKKEIVNKTFKDFKENEGF
jgi:hypothetical protein